MDVKVYDEPFSYVVIDNTHTENEINKIFAELSYLKEFFLLPENSGSAIDDDGNLLKKNKALFINEFYTKRKFSHILTAEDRFLDESHLPSMIPDDCYWELMQRTNQHSTLVSYYENSDYYQPHRDRSHFTMLTWLWKEPKRFTGGEITFHYKDQKITPGIKHNRSVIFPSTVLHSVDKIDMDSKYLNDMNGRFCISKFIEHNIGIEQAMQASENS